MASKIIEDLFGSDSDQDEDEAPEAEAAEVPELDGSDSEDDKPLSRGEKPAERFKSSLEEDDEMQEASAKRERPVGPPIDLEAPLLAPPESEAIKMFRQTNIMSVETRPFDPENFNEDEQIYMDVRGEKRYRLRQNVIRWRKAEDEYGEEVRESNARFVRWSDDSWQLLIGDEVLDVNEHNMMADKAHLFVRHPGLIQCLGALHNKITFRPARLDSETHRKMTQTLDKRYSKTAKTQRVRTTYDPEKEKDKMEKEEDARIRDKESLMRKQENVMSRYGGGGGAYGASSSHNYQHQQHHQQLDADYLEELEEDVPDYEGGGRRVNFEEEEAREQRILKAKRETPKAKKRPASPISSDGEGVEPSDSDQDEAPKQVVARKRGRQMALASDSD